MTGPPARGWSVPGRLATAGLAAAVALGLLYLAGLVRGALSPSEPYAAQIGMSLDQCAAAQPDLDDAQARAFCGRPVPKRR